MRHVPSVLLLLFALATARAHAAEPTTAPPAARAEGVKVRIVLVGDSTVAPNGGWGPGFAPLVSKEAEVVNWAKGGRSSWSFVKEGWWAKALADKPDYVLIQFGHNDQKARGIGDTPPLLAYREWMARLIDEARAAGARPVIVTSLTRRLFKGDKVASNLFEYADAAKAIAAEKKVPVIDLHARSIAELDKIGPRASVALNYVAKPKDRTPPTDKPDLTHVSPKGAELFGRVVAEELIKAVPELAPYVVIK
ncbi:MAG TPA: rhamnogalacturonan acetylesterase [Tepidisphaeraceae bacterium]|nr:rhamnogalacturonan acetylesterase [Tepidisphaeraceae bacterium]